MPIMGETGYTMALPYDDEAVQRCEKFWRDTAELFIDALWKMDHDGTLRLDPLKPLNFNLSNMMGKSLADLIVQDQAGLENSESIRRAISSLWTFRNLEFKAPGRFGEIRVVLVSGMPVFDSDDQYCGYSGAIADITEQRIIEESARQNKVVAESNRQREIIIAAAPICLLLCKGDPPQIVLANSAACELFEVSDDILRKTLMYDLIDSESDRQLVIKRLKADGFINQFDTACHISPGPARWGLFSIRKIDSIDGTAFLVGVVDITSRKQSELDLRNAKEAAEHALDQLQRTQKSLIQAEKMAATSLLVSGIAHEINTPVGTALTAATLLSSKTIDLNDLLNDKQLHRRELENYLNISTEVLGRIVVNITRAGELVESFKQVAADQSSQEHRSFDLSSYIREVLTSLGPRLRNGGHKLELTGLPTIKVDSYPGAIAQILTNLIINAIRHGFDKEVAGNIAITLNLEDDNIHIRCSDNGKGIPPEILGRIFDAFFTTSRADGGTGLGLHIVYTLVTTTLGGNITVHSEVGLGTSFDLFFPVVAPRYPVPVAEGI
ncbi:MAG: PAS domain-containing sensor histidine kinase [Rhodospirillaceae bacterium]